MPQLNRRALLAAATAASAPAVAAPAHLALSGVALREALALADLWLGVTCAYAQVPALSAGVSVNGALVWSRGYGGGLGGRTPDADTIYPIGSLSKLFNAVAAMRLVEDGRMTLDAPITRHLPWATPATGGPPTLRALLSHGSGLPRDAGPAWTPPDFAFPTEAQLRQAVREARPSDVPLTRFGYSNVAVALAGEAVRAAAGGDYAGLVRTRVLAPLGLKDTSPARRRDLLGRRTPGGYSARRRDGTRSPLPWVDVQAYAPAAGYSSSIRDLAAFAGWWTGLLAGRDAAGVLKPDTLREMLRPQYADPTGPGAGLGFITRMRGGQTLTGHDGELQGYRANLWSHLPSGVTVAVLRACSDGPGPYADGLLGLLAARARARETAGAGAGDLAAYAGRYSEAPWGGEGVVAPWAGRLAYVSAPTDDPAGGLATFQLVGPDLFRRVRADASLAEEVRFRRDAAGRVQDFVQHANVHRRVG